MSNSRREFLAQASLALLTAAALPAQDQQSATPPPAPGTPPTFGTAPAVGPKVSATTFAEAEKLVQIELTADERNVAAATWRSTMAALYERRTGPRKVSLEPDLAPASLWSPLLPGITQLPATAEFIRSNADPSPLPRNDEDIAFASVTNSPAGSRPAKITSERLTDIYLARLARFNSTLRCVITLTPDLRSHAGQTSRRGNRRRKISRPAARNSLGRERPSRHRRHPHHLRRRAVPQPHPR